MIFILLLLLPFFQGSLCFLFPIAQLELLSCNNEENADPCCLPELQVLEFPISPRGSSSAFLSSHTVTTNDSLTLGCVLTLFSCLDRCAQSAVQYPSDHLIQYKSFLVTLCNHSLFLNSIWTFNWVQHLHSTLHVEHIEGKPLLICVVSLPDISFIIDNLTQDWFCLNGRRDSTVERKETMTTGVN